MRKVEVILLEKINRLGNIGQVVSVAAGYARNFLVPKGKAWYFSDERSKMFEERKVQIEAESQKKLDHMKELAKRFDGFVLEIRQNASDNGVLYGSVSKSAVLKALCAAGFADIADDLKRSINMSDHIKELGDFIVPLHLHPDLVIQLPAVIKAS